MSDLISFSSEEKLSALRERDIFHHWDSLTRSGFAVAAARSFPGDEIKWSRATAGCTWNARLEGCPSVPMEWLMLELTTGDGEDEGVHTAKIAPGQDGGETPHQGRRFFPFSPPDF